VWHQAAESKKLLTPCCCFKLNNYQLKPAGLKSADLKSTYEPVGFAAGCSTSTPFLRSHVRNDAQVSYWII